MKHFLDNEREAPEGWVRVRRPGEAIRLLKAGGVSELSLDHDLGNERRGTGYDVVLWVEEAMATSGFVPPKMTSHSSNASAWAKMEAGLERIRRYAGRQGRLGKL